MEAIQQVVNNHVQSMIDSGAITKAIEDNVGKAVESAIESQFRSYGGITKQIETAIEEGLKIDPKDIPFESYNEQILVAVKTRLGNLFAETASQRFMSEMDRILAPAPKEMKINELVESIVSFWKTDDPYDANDLDEYATVELDQRDVPRSLDGRSLKMWKQKESGTYSLRTNCPDLELYILDGNIRISHRQAYNPTCFREEETLIFKLYSAGTLITGLDEFDPDDCDLALKDSEY